MTKKGCLRRERGVLDVDDVTSVEGGVRLFRFLVTRSLSRASLLLCRRFRDDERRRDDGILQEACKYKLSPNIFECIIEIPFQKGRN